MIWCPRHPAERLVRIPFPNGKFDLRCPGCTEDRKATIKVVPQDEKSD